MGTGPSSSATDRLAWVIDDAEKRRTSSKRDAITALDHLTTAEYALAAGDYKVVEEFIDRARTALESIRTETSVPTVIYDD